MTTITIITADGGQIDVDDDKVFHLTVDTLEASLLRVTALRALNNEGYVLTQPPGGVVGIASVDTTQDVRELFLHYAEQLDIDIDSIGDDAPGDGLDPDVDY